MTKKVIQTNPHYKTSTRIDSSQTEPKEFIDSFILHGTAINALEVLSLSIANSDQRAFTITGPYGSGKSTLALYLSYLVSQDKTTRKHALRKIEDTSQESKGVSERFNIDKGWVVIKHVYGLESPASSLLSSIYEGFGENFSKKKIASLSDGECLERIEATIAKHQNKSDGIILLLDEMGKALD